MTVQRSEIDQMASFLAASRGLDAPMSPGGQMFDYNNIPETTPAELRQYGIAPRSQAIAPPVPISTGDVNEMKGILARFYEAANNVISDAPNDRQLRNSFIEATPDGARMGRWEIKAKEVGKKKLYDVLHTATNERLAADLTIYEAAYGIVRILNEGGRINSPEVINLLRAEQDYAGAIHDMRLYKYHLNKTPNTPRKAIYEDRYADAKRKAIAARDSVEKLSGVL